MDPFVAEIRIFPFYFAPKGWALCNGQLLPISQNTALFSLLGTFYGGDGKSNFALPNLQGAAPMHQSSGSSAPPMQAFLGETGGSDTVTLITSEMPAHTHNVSAEQNHRNAIQTSPAGAIPANPSPVTAFSDITPPTLGSMNPGMVSIFGNSNPHNNLMPYLVLNFCIALQGVYPPRS